MSTSTISANRRKFCAVMAKLVSPLEVATAAEALLAMQPAMTDIPEAAFDEPGNLAAAMAKQFNRCPSLGQLHRAILEWWSTNKPSAPLLPGSDDPTMTREDQLILQMWERRRAEGFSHLTGSSTDRLTVALDTMRTNSSLVRVFRYLCRTDAECASIAVRLDWQVEPREHRDRTPEEVAAAKAEIERVTAEIRMAAEPRSSQRANDGVNTGRSFVDDAVAAAGQRDKPALLSPEQLASLRAIDPRVQRARAAQEALRKLDEAAEADATAAPQRSAAPANDQRRAAAASMPASVWRAPWDDNQEDPA